MEDNKKINTANDSSKKVFTIECKDIVLREYIVEDLDPIYNITLQPEIAEFLPDWVSTREQRKEWLTKYEINENREFFKSVPNIGTNILRLAVILKETNKLIGWITSGLKEGVPAPNREVGYGISRDYTCKGYATQAVQGLTKYLFENTDLEVLNAVALTYNTPSNKVIQKCGFKLVGNLDLENQDFYYYKLTKSEWENSRK